MQQAKQIINEEMEDIFEYLYNIYPDGNLIFRIYFNIIPELSSKGLDVNKISNDIIEDILKYIRDGKIVKDSIQYILSDFINNNKLDYDKYKPMTDEEIKNLILNIINNNKDLMNKQNKFQIIMGLVMKSSNGRAEGSRVSEIIKKIMEENGDEIRS